MCERQVSYLGVDTLMNRCPPLVKDIYYDFENVSLPYTEAAAAYKKKTYRGSVANMTLVFRTCAIYNDSWNSD